MTLERELSAFEGIPGGYERVLLTMDRIDLSRDGVRHRNVLDFLMEDRRS